MKQYIFKDATLGDYIKDNYVALEIDMETPEGIILAKKYGIGAEALLVKAEQTVRKKM